MHCSVVAGTTHTGKPKRLQSHVAFLYKNAKDSSSLEKETDGKGKKREKEKTRQEEWMFMPMQHNLINVSFFICVHAHHRCLRRILNISWQDKVRNERVRELTGQDQLLTKIREHRLRWWGHVQRMEGGRRAKQALNWIPEESHKIGGPRITWNDNTTNDIENSGVTWEEVLLLMTDE